MHTSTDITVPSAAADESSGDAQYLTFLINNEMFAINILGVKEIIEYGNITPIPMMPGFIRGVINLRGAVVSVVDLNARFGNAPSLITRRSCIVIIEGIAPQGDEPVGQDIGVVVDSVSEVLGIPQADIEPRPVLVPASGPTSSAVWARSTANSSFSSIPKKCCHSMRWLNSVNWPSHRQGCRKATCNPPEQAPHTPRHAA